MRKFSISRGSKLPDSVIVDGQKCSINPGFFSILKCLRAFGDEELSERDKSVIIFNTFYRDKVPSDPYKHFFEFVQMGDEIDTKSEGVKDFDYEQDAKEIYSSFWQLYGIDLFEENLHWWKFQALLNGAFACDTPISNKIRLRHADDSKGAQKASIDRAKKSVKIKKTGSEADKAIEDLVRERLMKGESIADLVK